MPVKIQHYLSFRLGSEWYGVDVNRVIEVLHLVALNEIPGTNTLGLMTLRNQVMPVIDLRRQFGLPPAVPRLDSPIIAVQSPKGGVGLLVDEADDVQTVAAADILPYDSPYIKQVARFSNGLLLLLDVNTLEPM